MIMNKNFGIRFVLATMLALTVAVTGCKDDPPGQVPGGSGGDGGMGGMGGTGGAALSVSADPATTTFGALGAITTDTIDVALTASDAAATIYYTTDATEVQVPGGAGGAGGAPASTTMEYTGAITIDANTVLKFLAVAADGTTTAQQVEGYTLTPDDETLQWSQRGHGMILDEPWRHWDEDGVIGDPSRNIACAKCHSAAGFLEYAATEMNTTAQALPLGLDCTACHAANPTTWSDATTYPWLQDVLFPSGVRQDLAGNSNMCITCHQGRESTDTVNADIADCSNVGDCDADCTPMAGAGGAGGAGGASGCEGLGFINIHYYAAGATFFGTDVRGGYEYVGQTYVGQNLFDDHGSNLSDCIQCHMQANPTGGAHLFVPDIATCSGAICHGTPAEFTELEGKPSESYDAIQALLPALLTEIQTYATDTLGEPIDYRPDDYPYWFNGSGEPYQFDATLVKGAYNYQTGLKDPGGYIHNGDYIQQILADSISDLGGTPPGTRP